jgi:hypothetical protein
MLIVSKDFKPPVAGSTHRIPDEDFGIGFPDQDEESSLLGSGVVILTV